MSQRTALVLARLRHERHGTFRRPAGDRVGSPDGTAATGSALQRRAESDGPATGSKGTHALRVILPDATRVRRPTDESGQPLEIVQPHDSNGSSNLGSRRDDKARRAGRLGQAIAGGPGKNETGKSGSRNKAHRRVRQANTTTAGTGSSARTDSRTDAATVGSATGRVSAASGGHVATDAELRPPDDHLRSAQPVDADAVLVVSTDVRTAVADSSDLGQFGSDLEYSIGAAAATSRAVAVQPATPIGRFTRTRTLGLALRWRGNRSSTG